MCIFSHRSKQLPYFFFFVHVVIVVLLSMAVHLLMGKETKDLNIIEFCFLQHILKKYALFEQMVTEIMISFFLFCFYNCHKYNDVQVDNNFSWNDVTILQIVERCIQLHLKRTEEEKNCAT